MIFQKKIKAGILLQSLLLFMVFTLFLQFYLYKISIVKKQMEKSIVLHQASIMAELTRQSYQKDIGEMVYDKGICSYMVEKNELKVVVKMNNGAVYFFKYHQ